MAHAMPVSMPDCRTVAEVLATVGGGDPAWHERYVTLRFAGDAAHWVTVYPVLVGGDPYFDFAYTGKTPPRHALPAVFERYSTCAVIDWCVGRLACIQVAGADLHDLVGPIEAVAASVFGLDRFEVEAFYEDAERA